MSAATRAMDLAVLVDELLDHVAHVEDTTWVPSSEALAAVAARLGRPDAVPARLPAAGPRRRLSRAPGLLDQLGALDGHAWAASGDTSTRSTPESRVPPGGRAVEALAGLHGEILALWVEVGGKGRPDPRAALRGLVGRVPDLDDDTIEHVYRSVSGWARTLRIELGWEVGIMHLPNSYCPNCEQPDTLRCKADASGDVWCSGNLIGPGRPGEQHPRRCGQFWPQHQWLALLDDVRRREHAARQRACTALAGEAS